MKNRCCYVVMLLTVAVCLFTATVLSVQAQVGLVRSNGGNWWRNTATMDLDFYNNRYLLGNTLYSDIISLIAANPGTFTRASSATYIDSSGNMQTVGNNVLRTVNYVGGVNQGPLYEEDRTNTVSASAVINTNTTKINTSVAASAVAAPDGTTMYKVVENTTTGPHILRWSNLSLTANSTYTASVYVKAGERSVGTILGNDGTANRSMQCNAAAGSSSGGATGLSGSHSIVAVGNGVYRCTLTFTSGQTTDTGFFDFRLSDNASPANGGANYTGDGTSGIYLWGAQFEAAADASSYIATTTAPATRAADQGSSFTRNTTATYFDSAGNLQTANPNRPRLDYDPVTRAPRGVLIEEARTNLIKNSTMQGAVVGSPGTRPTNWTLSNPGGVNFDIAGSGTENGIKYVDVRIYGSDSTGGVALNLDSTVGNAGETYTFSENVKMIAGSYTNILVVQTQLLETGGGGAATAIVPDGTPLSTQRNFTTKAMSTTTSANLTPRLRVQTNGSFDITLRVGAPQMELGSIPTSFIPTSTVAVTRAQDNFYIPVGSWYTAGIGTFMGEGTLPYTGSGKIQRMFGFGDAVNYQNSAGCYMTSADKKAAYLNNAGTSLFNQSAADTYLAGDLFICAFAYQDNDFRASWNSVLSPLGSSGSIPAFSRFYIGNGSTGIGGWNGYVRRATYFPTRQPDHSLNDYTR